MSQKADFVRVTPKFSLPFEWENLVEHWMGTSTVWVDSANVKKWSQSDIEEEFRKRDVSSSSKVRTNEKVVPGFVVFMMYKT